MTKDLLVIIAIGMSSGFAITLILGILVRLPTTLAVVVGGILGTIVAIELLSLRDDLSILRRRKSD